MDSRTLTTSLPPGKYQNQQGQSVCRLCLVGFTSYISGARNPNQCKHSCPIGEHSTTQGTLISAAAEHTLTRIYAGDTCTPCDKGSFQVEEDSVFRFHFYYVLCRTRRAQRLAFSVPLVRLFSNTGFVLFLFIEHDLVSVFFLGQYQMRPRKSMCLQCDAGR